MQLFARIAVLKKRQSKDLKRLWLFSLKNRKINPHKESDKPAMNKEAGRRKKELFC
jgi:hypothetical protein